MSARTGPGDSNAGPVAGDRRTAEHLTGQLQRTTAPQQSPAWHAVADVRTVVGRGGNPRLVLLVARCPGCRQPHLHLARVPFVATVRRAACGAAYVLHARNSEAAA